MREELFLKNTQALFEVDETLAYKLRSLKNITFKLIQNENGINFAKDEILLYQNPNQELLENLSLFQSEYAKYPVLFFYGFGNGMLYKSLCENKNHQHIVVFEDDLEILALAFYLFDFSEALKNEKLILFHTQTLNTPQLSTLFSYEIIQKSVKIFNLFIHSDFYQKFQNTQIQNTNTQLMEMIRFIVLNKGNDPHDSLVGIKHTLDNLPKMLNHGIFQEFLKERRTKVKNAIIVSTGPSLIKQLPLLKKYANKATIFCADSAYVILGKYGIKPDYVCMLERDDIVSKCFDNNFGNFNKGILFILASVVHKEVLDFLEKDQRTYMLVHRPLNFAASLKLEEYGYLGVGHSVSNMIYELAGALRFENIIFIGQDLAYSEDGSSHPKEHIHGSQGEEIRGESYTLAYGGKGKVRTQLTWNLFRQAFEKDIFWTKEKLHINTYNCTEGGARIEGTIEKPFLWACENLLDEDLNKPFDFPKILDKKQAKEKLEKTKKYLQKNILESKEFIKKAQTQLQKLRYTLEKNKDDFHTLEKIKNNLLNLFKEFKKLKFFNELTRAIYFHNECEILKFEVLNANKQKENLIDFLKIQHNWFVQGLGYLDAQNQTIEKSLENWNFDDIAKK
ncbi:motility associated factor glycosyltransferase family protein [Campylobacter jejuni]|uniref:motility associated factor glycosyltransferase family protein n=1 Tax=Campylobacter jejuni TaxID=197 RepID=UPI0009A8D7DD|nr:motility associated factor glycosyltransferase family protein [Campylobacter jejuni]EAK8011295.1 motility associated factor glycosyltransferase family protein [Campylobacter jejuni]ECL4946384.1 motility associated factor glycosyltransferase family protein [Campylobacter jejuni]ECQ5548488.1 motility associated factor glycosyltransferase family protein [Campylobacter jejuni]ECR1834641.1 motility associated factor glycosyltransferase family protein [Campylobacter jejuni]ECR2206072.1 motility a